ncbi:hypothetical protein [Methanobacterium spitsbergense]|uniref:Uncharacterized protein n=1 Tax=Methanobacterium spitsbergense TaxID=2874285 RepID=A0A8T5V3Q8_9EURY|nr:hypothetical protein [Methanobacterium spitsbergense]MBZ2166295.1 hypothetical protein [Methanobacterium spitsbergense]
MVESKIPKLFKTETIDINGTKVEIKGFRGNDYAILRTLNKIQNETLGIQTRYLKITKGKEGTELTDEEINEAIPIRNEIEDLNEKTQPLIEKLGQRGIKRAFNPKIRSTDSIDKIPDVEIEYPYLRQVYGIMSRISTPSEERTDKKKEQSP